jgi:hypothetical protein
MADPLKVFTGLLDAIGESTDVAKAAVKPSASLKVAKAASKGYFSDLAKTGYDYFKDIVAKKQDVPAANYDPNAPWNKGFPTKPDFGSAPTSETTVTINGHTTSAQGEDSAQKALDAIYEALGLPQPEAPPKPVPIPKAPPVAKPFNFADTAVKTAQQQQLKLPPTVAPPTMHPDVLPEAARQAARLKGNYVTEAFRGVKVMPGGDFQGQFKGGELYSSVSTKLADLYSGYLSKHPGPNPAAGSYPEGASAVPLWIDTSDYLKVDAKGAKWTAFNAKAIQEAKAAGKKGVVIDNVWDEPNSTHVLEGPQKIFITFPNGQSTVKSKFAARFDPKSTDISRSIAAVGITGAAGAVAMAPGDAKAGELPDDGAALPANSSPTEGEGYFADLLKPDQKVRDPKDVSIFFRGEDDPNTLAPSTHSGLGRVKDIPSDTADVFKESVEQYKSGKQATGEAFSKDELKAYSDYQRAYEAWEAGGMKGEPPKNPGTGPLKALKGISDVTGGFLSAVTSPIMGAFRSLVSKPVEEKTGFKHEWTEAVGSLAMPVTGVFKYGKAAPAAKTVVSETATFLNRIFNPEKIGKGERAETLIRNALGVAARDTETTKAAFNDYFKTVNQLDDNDKVALIGYIEGRTKGATIKDPALQPVADAIKTAVDQRKTKLQALPSTHQMAFVEDYYTHQWENPQAAQAFTKNWFAKQGTGKNLKKRSIPTIADGMAAGLVPKTLNPLETITDYVTNMDRFIAHNAIIDAGRAVKDVKYYRNPQVAAKLGLVKLDGRLAMRRTPYGDMQAYAPKDWARVYNNSIAKGWHQWETAGQIYDKLQTTSNSITAMELGLSGYHLLTMVNEGSIASVANAVSQAVSGVGALTRGQMGEAAKLLAGSAKSAVTAPFALGVKPYLGHKAQQVYLGRQTGSALMRKTMDLLEAGGGRAVGRTHAADYKFSAANSYFTAFKRGELLASLKQDFSGGMLRGFARQMGRTLQSVAQPLFDVYIPKMKVGAFHENMSAWLAANPTASYPDQVAMAKRIWDSVDNRFGEVVQDNIFWHTMLKQTAQLGMRSYSWNLGTIREIGGGAKNLLTNPKGLGLKGTSYDPKIGYVVALPITTALTNAIYQYAMTGKMPESVEDLVAPRTGGMVPGLGGRGQVEERAQLPSYMKDVFGWYEDWYQEMLNKRSSLVATIGELAANRDWKNDPIVNPEHSAPEWMKEYFEYASKFLPISVKQGAQGEKKGSKLGLQSYLGIRPSPAQFTDPKGLASIRKYQGEQIDKKRRKTEARQKQIYGGPTD